MIKQELKKPIKYQEENLNNAKKFCGDFLNYMKTDSDVQEFYTDGDWSIHPFTNEVKVGSGWNTGHRFNLEYIDTVQLIQGIGLHFRLNKLRGLYIEYGVLENGEKALKRVFEFVPTDLNFYIQYFGDNFTLKVNNF